MLAVTWAALGILSAAVFGMFAFMAGFAARVDGRFDSVNARIDGRFDGLNARIDGLARDLGGVARDLGERIDRQSSRIDALAGVMNDHISPHAG
jgi:hypothetical protein